MVFETASSDELAYAVDIQDNDLDKLWKRYRVFDNKEQAEIWAEALRLLDDVNQAIVYPLPSIEFAKVGV